jgi:hypothetical protein
MEQVLDLGRRILEKHDSVVLAAQSLAEAQILAGLHAGPIFWPAFWADGTAGTR